MMLYSVDLKNSYKNPTFWCTKLITKQMFHMKFDISFFYTIQTGNYN